MANWKRGFFRLWALLAALWVVGIGTLMVGTITNPYVPDTLFTFNKDDELEVVPRGTEKYSKLLTDESAGYYTRVGFQEDAPRVFYMAPNVFTVSIRDKNFEALISNERLKNEDREGLVTALLDYIERNDLDLDPPISESEVRAAIPQQIELAYREPWVKFQVRDFAIATQQTAMDEARRSSLGNTVAVMFTLLPETGTLT
tara:strand:+ start:969 stop:1571 length:603 start_codon:yes stop_codon:yes gene_type:complete